MGGDRLVELDPHGVGPHAADPFGKDHRTLVQRRAAGGLHRGHDVGGGDRTVQLGAGLRPGGPYRQGHRQGLELLADLLGVLNAADLAGVTGPFDAFDLFLGALGVGDRVALRQQVVTPVARLDVDDVAGHSELAHGGGENQLHRTLLLVSAPSTRTAAGLPRGHS